METNTTRYLVTKLFTSGPLAGLSHTGISPVPFVVGRNYFGEYTVTALEVER